MLISAALAATGMNVLKLNGLARNAQLWTVQRYVHWTYLLS